MSGFLGGYLSPGLTAATQLATGYESGQAQAKKEAQALALQQLAQQRQAHQDEIKDALTMAQTKAITDPQAKPKRSTATFKLNGKATLGSMDEGGTYYDGAGNPVTAGLEPFDKTESDRTPRTFMVNGKPMEGFSDKSGKFYDASGAPVGGKITPYVPPDKPTFTPVTMAGDAPDAPPVIKPFSTRTGQAGPAIGNAKPPVTRIESATNTASKARLEAAVAEMNNAHAGMADFEQKLASGQIKINGLEQFVGSAGSSFTHDDPASRAIQTTTLTALNRTNPELARYIRRALSFAEGESMISNRPSDFRTKMSAFLSQAASGASPEMIHDIQSRRTSILNPLNRTVTPPPAAGAGNVNLGPPSVSPLRVKYDAAANHLRAQGKTDADIAATIGPPPGDED